MQVHFKNRQDAGEHLAHNLVTYKDNKEGLILAIPRGGVVIAHEVAKALHIPLDIIIPRKIGAPLNPELAIGAVCEDEVYFNESLIEQLEIDKNFLDSELEKAKKEALRRNILYRKNKKTINVNDKIIILIDDGIATGATILTAIKFLKQQNIKKLVVATAVCSLEMAKRIEKEVDEFISLLTPHNMTAIGLYYEEFEQVHDEEVINILQQY
jgi:predicted phosphoribosyltransferase